MQKYLVGTPEAVDIAYDIAGIGSRFMASVIDSIIGAVLLIILVLGAMGLASLPGPGPTLAVIVLLTLGFVLFWGYYILFETLWSGQTPGKRWLRIRVIQTSGHPVGFIEAAVRNLVRIVDWLPLFYGIGITCMFISPRSRRLGDLAAGTLVVKERSRVHVDDLVPAVQHSDEGTGNAVAGSGPSGEELQWSLHALTHDDLRITIEYLDRAQTLRSDARDRIGQEVADLVARRIGAEGSRDPATFLRRVVDLHNSAT